MEQQTLARIPLPSPEAMDPDQRRVYDAIVGGRRGRLVGPLRAALHRPELADKWQQLGELLRYRTSLPPALSEIAVLVTARRWNCQLEWHMHALAAAEAGVPETVSDAIKHGRRPDGADAKALAVHDYAHALVGTGSVPEPVYDAARMVVGDVGLVELTALVGYYSMVAMTLNAHEIPLPDGAQPALPALT